MAIAQRVKWVYLIEIVVGKKEALSLDKNEEQIPGKVP